MPRFMLYHGNEIRGFDSEYDAFHYRLKLASESAQWDTPEHDAAVSAIYIVHLDDFLSDLSFEARHDSRNSR